MAVRAWLAVVLVLLPLCAWATGIERSQAEVRQFRAAHACPATGLHRGRCDGWQVDHTVPLCAGGRDAQDNMAWLTVADHRFKTFVDVRECRKLRRMAARPALLP